MKLSEKFPPLYQCEVCGKKVRVIIVGEGIEPIIERSCACPVDTPVLAKRKVTLRGKGDISFMKQQQIKITMTVRQFLCWATGRSI